MRESVWCITRWPWRGNGLDYLASIANVPFSSITLFHCPTFHYLSRHHSYTEEYTDEKKWERERAVMESTMTTLNLWGAIDYWPSGLGAGICELRGGWADWTPCLSFFGHACPCHSACLRLCTYSPLGKECLFGCCFGSCRPFKTVQLAHEVPFSISIWIMTLDTLVVAQHWTRLFQFSGSVHVRGKGQSCFAIKILDMPSQARYQYPHANAPFSSFLEDHVCVRMCRLRSGGACFFVSFFSIPLYPLEIDELASLFFVFVDHNSKPNTFTMATCLFCLYLVTLDIGMLFSCLPPLPPFGSCPIVVQRCCACAWCEHYKGRRVNALKGGRDAQLTQERREGEEHKARCG